MGPPFVISGNSAAVVRQAPSTLTAKASVTMAKSGSVACGTVS